jgi:hypothetical protein
VSGSRSSASQAFRDPSVDIIVVDLPEHARRQAQAAPKRNIGERAWNRPPMPRCGSGMSGVIDPMIA